MELMLASSATAAPPDIPAWMIAVGALATGMGIFMHWRFRTGWHLKDDHYRGRSAAREFVVMLGYAALPTAIAAACLTAALILFKVAGDKPTAAVGYPIMAFAVGFVVAAIWMAKEYMRPTQRRTPHWLK